MIKVLGSIHVADVHRHPKAALVMGGWKQIKATSSSNSGCSEADGRDELHRAFCVCFGATVVVVEVMVVVPGQQLVRWLVYGKAELAFVQTLRKAEEVCVLVVCLLQLQVSLPCSELEAMVLGCTLGRKILVVYIYFMPSHVCGW